MTSPLSMSLVTIWCTSLAKSGGVARDALANRGGGGRALLPDGARRGPDAGAMDRADELARCDCSGDAALPVGFLADTAAHEAPADLGGHGGAALILQVGDDDAC